jgi:hypothetical protein
MGVDTSDLSSEAIRNLLSMYVNKKLIVDNVVVTDKLYVGAEDNPSAVIDASTGNATVNGKLTVKNGSDFSGGRHYFRDVETPNAPLRVGGAWNIPGIYSEKGDVVVGAQSGWMNLASELRGSRGDTYRAARDSYNAYGVKLNTPLLLKNDQGYYVGGYTKAGGVPVSWLGSTTAAGMSNIKYFFTNE